MKCIAEKLLKRRRLRHWIFDLNNSTKSNWNKSHQDEKRQKKINKTRPQQKVLCHNNSSLLLLFFFLLLSFKMCWGILLIHIGWQSDAIVEEKMCPIRYGNWFHSIIWQNSIERTFFFFNLLKLMWFYECFNHWIGLCRFMVASSIICVPRIAHSIWTHFSNLHWQKWARFFSWNSMEFHISNVKLNGRVFEENYLFFKDVLCIAVHQKSHLLNSEEFCLLTFSIEQWNNFECSKLWNFHQNASTDS